MRKISRIFIYSCIIAVLVLFSVSLFWRNSLLLTSFLVVLSVVMVGIGKIKEDTYLYIIVFFTGAIAEAIAIAFSAWTYSLPNIIGIPIWLPFVWGNTGVFIKRLYSEISYLNLLNKF